MPTYDTLSYAGNEQKLADRGFTLDSCQGFRNVLKADTFDATAVAVDSIADPLFAFEAQVMVRSSRVSADGSPNSFSGGTIKFQGKCISARYGGGASGPTVRYHFEGPWYDLEHSQYLQLYKGQAAFFEPGEIVLFSSTNNPTHALLYPISVGDMIQSVLQWLLDQYAAQGLAAPFQYKGRTLNAGAIDLTWTAGGDPLGRAYSFGLDAGSTIDPALFALYLPSYIAKPMTCAQAIQKCLELSPRTNVAFDYSTTPPTVQVRSVDNFPSVTMPLYDGISHKSFALTKREDLQARAVVLTYRITETIAGTEVIDYALDKWGPHGAASGSDPSSGLRVVADTIDLQGFNLGISTGHLDCEPLGGIGGSTFSKRAWWASRRGGEFGKVTDSRVRFQSVVATNVNITAATNASPIAITTGTAHGMATGNSVVIGEVLGNTAANGVWVVTVTGSTTFTLNGSTGSGAYTSGGVATCYVPSAVGIPDARYFYATAGLDTTGASVVAGQELTAADYAFYTSRLVRGAFHAWMKLGSTQVRSCKVRGFASFTFAEYDAVTSGDTNGQLPASESVTEADMSGNVMHRTNATEHHVDMEITNGTTGEYATESSFTSGEGYVIGNGGIAQYLFNALNKPQYEGEYVKVEADFAAGVSPLSCLNLSGGRTEWTTMNAQVQSVREDYGTHETYVQVGPAKHLSAAQLSSLLNMWRFRRTWYNPAMRTDNTQLSTGSDTDMAEATGGPANTTKGTQSPQGIVAIDYNTPNDPTSGPRVIIMNDAAAVK